MTKLYFLKVIKLIVVNLIIIILLLILVDPFIGWLIKDAPGVSRTVNFKENPPLSFQKIKPDEAGNEKKPVMKRTGKYGFILGPGESSLDDIDIIFMGASIVEAENVRENKRFPYLSVKKLNDSLNTNLISRNAGVGGNLLSTTNLLLTTKVIPLEPEYVVLSSSLIDLLYLSKNQSYWTGSKKYLSVRNPKNEVLRGIKDMLFPNIWFQLRKFIIISDDSNFLKSSKFSSEDKSRILSQYEKQLHVFINTCLIYGITPILTTDYYVASVMHGKLQEKGIFDADETEFYINNLIPSLNQIIENTANYYNVPLIKLHEKIEQDKSFVNKEDGLHLTNRGSEKVSEVISHHLIDNIQNEEN